MPLDPVVTMKESRVRKTSRPYLRRIEPDYREQITENCSAITEAVLHEVSSREWDNYFVNRVP